MELIKLTAGMGGVSIAQTLGPLKRVMGGSKPTSPAMKLQLRFTNTSDDGLVLVQTAAPAQSP